MDKLRSDLYETYLLASKAIKESEKRLAALPPEATKARATLQKALTELKKQQSAALHPRRY